MNKSIQPDMSQAYQGEDRGERKAFFFSFFFQFVFVSRRRGNSSEMCTSSCGVRFFKTTFVYNVLCKLVFFQNVGSQICFRFFFLFFNKSTSTSPRTLFKRMFRSERIFECVKFSFKMFCSKLCLPSKPNPAS